MNEHVPALVGSPSYPLAALHGCAPSAPPWFQACLAAAPERVFINVDGAEIETLSWGRRGEPGLLLLHGQGACADWWSFIAPFFAPRFRVTAFSWSGMGRSGWRAKYEMGAYAQEMFAVARECGHYEAICPPLIVAHSFGGMPLLLAATDKGPDIKGAVLVDGYLSGAGRKPPAAPPRNLDKIRNFPSLAAALARFRLLPHQECDNLFLVDHIARQSLMQQQASVELPAGWRWRVDPDIRRKTTKLDCASYLPRVRCPIALMRGGRSNLCSAEHHRYALSLAPEGTPLVSIPDADHHVMLDQPLALVAALDGLFVGWPGR